MREIKVRVWTGKEYRYPPPIGEWDFEDCEMFAGYHKGHEHEQFTGLHDRHGKAICEGDIVRFAGGYRQAEVVEWLEGAAGFDPFITADEADDAFSVPRPDHCEVIGSVHENPELLEKV